MNKKVKYWILPLVLAGIIFAGVRQTFAQIVERQANLAQYLTANDVEVGSEAVDSYSQVYYIFEGTKTYVSKDGQNKIQPHSSGEYVVWSGSINGAGQIYLHNLATGAITQLTNASTNLEPKVSRTGKVVWERWVIDRWQVFVFDGISVRQLTEGDLSINPYIEGDNVIFARRDVTGEWRATLYSLKDEKIVDVAFGPNTKFPSLQGGKIVFLTLGTEKVEEFPLTAEDIELLGFSQTATATLTEPEVISTEEVEEELEANPFIEIDEATPSAEPSGEIE